MSQLQPYRIHCPKCRHEHNVKLYDSINVSDSPDLKDAFLANRLNSVTCEACDFTFRVDKSLLYHDPRNKIMIYLIPTSPDSLQAGQEEFQNSMHALNQMLPGGMGAPEVHLVLRREELVERIFLCEVGLDERIIEYIKYIIYTKNLEKLNPSQKALLFDAQDSNSDNLYFVIQDLATQQLEGVLEYDRQAYTVLSEMFDCDDKTANLYELFPGPYISARFSLMEDLQDTGQPRGTM